MIWKINKILFTSIEILLEIFITFFIWERLQDLRPILAYGLFYFISIPIATLAAGLLSDRINTKIPALLGIWLNVGQIALVMFLQGNLNAFTIGIIATLGGLATGLKNLPILAIDFFNKNETDEAKFQTKKALRRKVLNIALPLITVYAISLTGNFNIFFLALLGILLISAILTSMKTIETVPTTKYDLKSAFTFPGTNPDKISLMKGAFIESLTEGVNFHIVPIIVLSMAKNLLNWGYVNSFVATAALIAGLMLSRGINNKNSRTIYAISALIFAGISVIFVGEFTFGIVIAYLISRSVMEIIQDIGYNTSVEMILDEDKEEVVLYSEYQFLIELISGVGRILPLLILLMTNVDINDPIIIRIILIAAGLIPLVAISILGKPSIFIRNRRNKFAYVRRNQQGTLPSLSKISGEGLNFSE